MQFGNATFNGDVVADQNVNISGALSAASSLHVAQDYKSQWRTELEILSSSEVVNISAFLQSEISALSAAIAGVTPDHNSLLGLQGGISGQYYHLTAAQNANFIGKTDVAGISAYIQSEINQLIVISGAQNDRITVIENTYTPLTTTSGVSAYLQDQISSVAAITAQHNGLLGLQGGISGQYYHLSAAQFGNYIGKTEVANISAYLDNRITNIDVSSQIVGISSYLQSEIDTLRSDVVGITSYIQSEIDELAIPLSGGSAGYVLEKNSSGDYDFVWSNNRYTNSTPVPVTIGGIASGTTFSNQTMIQMFDQLLYPYQSPTFSSFTWSGLTTPVEVGVTISGSKSFTWATTNSSNIQTNSITIRDNTNATDLATGLANDGAETVSIISVQKVTATSHVWRIIGTNTQSSTFTRDSTINWQWRRYYGESTTTPLTETDIKALRVNGLASGYAATYSFVGGGYKYFAWSTALGTATSFKDTSNNLPVPMETVYTVSVTNNGVTQNYYVYRTTNILGGSINIQVT